MRLESKSILFLYSRVKQSSQYQVNSLLVIQRQVGFGAFIVLVCIIVSM